VGSRDDRAALGLAGVAIKAGARSTLASLWSINDKASSLLVAEFYRQLMNPAFNRAQALQAAQMMLLKYPQYDHPMFLILPDFVVFILYCELA
jgi:CHAT domain-containing protein